MVFRIENQVSSLVKCQKKSDFDQTNEKKKVQSLLKTLALYTILFLDENT